MELIDKIRKIKFERLSEPEKLLHNIFDGIISFNGKIDLNKTYFIKGTDYYFLHNNEKQELRYDYDLIYLKISPYFNHDYKSTCDFVGGWFKKNTGLNVVYTYQTSLIKHM